MVTILKGKASLQIKFGLSYILIIVVVLVILNTYPLLVSEDLVFRSKETNMTGSVSVVVYSLAGLNRLNQENVAAAMAVVEETGLSRVLVTDSAGLVLYDTRETGSAVGKYTFYSEIVQALEGYDAFSCSYRDGAFRSRTASPVLYQNRIIGAVYAYEYDTEQAALLEGLQSNLLKLSAGIAAAVVLLSFILSRMLTRKIRALLTGIRKVREGEYSHRVEPRGRDEMAQLADEFNQLTGRLQTTEEVRRRFVSDASHERKTPLASIRLLSDSIVQNENMDADTVREFVTDIGNEAERLQRTTEKLLDLSRLDDDIQVMPEPVDMKLVAVDAMVLLRPLADERQVRIRCDLADGCVVMATVDDMFHIIFNLIENAIKYNVTGGSVFLSLRGDEDEIKFTVEDTGIGIPEEDRYNIFTRFYRVDKARSREAGGSGLGLSIVHDAVKAHGGSIMVGENKPQGSRFTVSFPRPTAEETGI